MVLVKLAFVSFLIRSTPNSKVTLKAMEAIVKMVVNFRFCKLLTASVNMASSCGSKAK
jgi:hypothetical protein